MFKGNFTYAYYKVPYSSKPYIFKNMWKGCRKSSAIYSATQESMLLAKA